MDCSLSLTSSGDSPKNGLGVGVLVRVTISWSLLPLLSHGTCPLVLGSGEDEIAEDNPESQEMLEEQLVRMLTREVMDLISKWHAGTRELLGSPTQARLVAEVRADKQKLRVLKSIRQVLSCELHTLYQIRRRGSKIGT